MDDTETLVLIASLIAAAIVWFRWYRTVLGINVFQPLSNRLLLLFAPLGGMLLLLYVLGTFTSNDIRNDPVYFIFYAVLGFCWVGLFMLLTPFCGISVRDDAVERHNLAASYAIGGALIGLVLCYAGGNIGQGADWWIVPVSASFSTVALLLVWLVLQVATNISDEVTVGRDTASGLRLAGFLIAAGLVLGRAVAGDWMGFEDLVTEFVRFGWPVIMLVVLAAVAELRLRPSVTQPLRPALMYGVAPALVYIGLASLLLVFEPLSLSQKAALKSASPVSAPNSIYSMAFPPDEKTIITGVKDNSVFMLYVTSGQDIHLHALEGHIDPVIRTANIMLHFR